MSYSPIYRSRDDGAEEGRRSSGVSLAGGDSSRSAVLQSHPYSVASSAPHLSMVPQIEKGEVLKGTDSRCERGPLV